MKKIVTEIRRDTLVKMLPLFGIETQITFLDEDQGPQDSSNCTEQSFTIEENILDLGKVLSLCDDVDYARTPIRKKVDWNEFCDFWELILNVQKQREFGYPMTNIEYLYQKGLQLNFPIKLERASAELGFPPEENYAIVTGKSALGEMQLYQDDDLNFLEYVFSIRYPRVKRFSKKTVIDGTHWHPRGLQMALDDMIAFMNGDREYFKIRNFCFIKHYPRSSQ